MRDRFLLTWDCGGCFFDTHLSWLTFLSCNHGVVGGKAQYFWVGLTPPSGSEGQLGRVGGGRVNVLNVSCVCLMILLQLCGDCPQCWSVDWDVVSLPELPGISPSRPSRMRSAPSSGRSPPPSPSCRCWRRPVSSQHSYVPTIWPMQAVMATACSVQVPLTSWCTPTKTWWPPRVGRSRALRPSTSRRRCVCALSQRPSTR